MLQLVRNARLSWTGMLDLVGLMPPGPYTTSSLEGAAQLVRDTARLTKSVRDLLADPNRRGLLHQRIADVVVVSDELLGRWAGVMLNADVYAEIIDRHVELVGDIAWLGSLLAHFEPPDAGARARSWSDPAFQIEGELDDCRLASRIVAITQLAADLDHTTLQLALRIVPIEWWATRLGTTAPNVNASRELS